VRTRDVRLGETYLVEVPHRLPASRYPQTDHADPSSPWWRLWWWRGCRFRLIATELDAAADPPMVEGLRVVRQSVVRLDLAVEQVAELGLPPGAYSVQGPLLDGNGRPVLLPDVDTVVVPVRWLYPADADRPPSHRDLDRHDR